MSIGKTIVNLIEWGKHHIKWRNSRIDLIGNGFIRGFSCILTFIALYTPIIFIEASLIYIMMGVAPPITAILLSCFAVFFVAAILPVVFSYSIGVIKKARNDKLSKELKKEGVEPSRILDLFTCVKDLEFTVECLGLQKLMLIFDADKLDTNDIRQILNNKEAVQRINSIDATRLKLMLNSSTFNSREFRGSELYIEEILNDQAAVDGLNSIYEDKLKLIFDSSSFDFGYIEEILRDQEAVNRLNCINKNRLTLMLQSDKFHGWKIKRILRNQEIIDRINATSFSALEIMVNGDQLSGNQIVSLYKNENFEVRKIERNMRLALSLHKVGKIDSITTDYLLNDDRIDWDIIDCLGKSHKFDRRAEHKIEETLQTEFTINEESDEQHHSTPTRLGFLCLEQMIIGRVLSPIKHPEPSL